MRRYILNHPSAEPLTLLEVKRWLRVDHEDDNQLIDGLVRAARERVEARTGRALLAQTWRIVMDQWPADGRIALPIMPVISVAAVRVADASGQFNAIASTGYSLDARLDPAILTMKQIIQPAVTRGGVEIDIVAGYGAQATDCPQSLRQAMLMMIAEVYARRGPDPENTLKAPVGNEIERLLSPYASIRLGRLAMTGGATA
jgi:uncharacterized phiE125 gp8 family phage protein